MKTAGPHTPFIGQTQQWWEGLAPDDPSRQIAFDVAQAAAEVGPEMARKFIARGRAAYKYSLGGEFQGDFIEGMVLYHEGRLEEARSCFANAYRIAGKSAFADADGRYADFFFGAVPRVKGSPRKLARRGDELLERGDYEGAIGVWRAGLAKLSDGEDGADWFLASIGDAQFLLGDLEGALGSLLDALAQGGTGNAFVWLRLGQVRVGLGQVDAGVEALTSAYMLAGDEVWEDEDPKYRQLLVDRGIIHD